MTDANRVIDAKAGELETVDQAVMGQVVGVAQAIGDMRKALDTLDGLLDDRQFEKAAAAGYQDIASAFIFLQRTLGGLHGAELDRHTFISSVAKELQCAYEDAEPFVAARLQCLKPKPELTEEELAAARVRFEKMLDRLVSEAGKGRG